jgi:hypothetical protein
MLIVPQLRRDPQFIARNPRLAQHEADPVLIAIDGRAIEVAVPNLDRAPDRMRYLVRGNMVGSEGSESDGGHLRSRV